MTLRSRTRFFAWAVLHSAYLVVALNLTIHGTSAGSVPGEDPAKAVSGQLVLVVGAAGTDEYARMFNEWADRWAVAAASGQVAVTIVGRESAPSVTDRQRLQAILRDPPGDAESSLWLVLIGHGTFDGRQARFNLRGTDVSAADLAEWLQECERPLAVINCASASAPFIDRLTGPDRVVVTATKSGREENFSRFGDYLSQAVADETADLNKDAQVSLLEAFLRASRQTQAYYDGQRQLATEHALLEDNGDARGVRADFYTGLQPTGTSPDGVGIDGLRAHQWHLISSDEERRLPLKMRKRRDELELQLAELRRRKSELDESEYFRMIEPLLVEIARLYASTNEAEPTSDAPATGSDASRNDTSTPEASSPERSSR